jgi:hypothetical protein
MAGSYKHVITDRGNLVSNERFPELIENLGDAYEMAEEMYGMIWWLAHMAPDSSPMSPEDLVELARKNYHVGLEIAKQNKNKGKQHGR